MTPDEIIEAETSESDQTHAIIAEDTAPEVVPALSEDVSDAEPPAEEPQPPIAEEQPEEQATEQPEELETPADSEESAEAETLAEDEETEAAADSQAVEAATAEAEPETEPETALDEAETPAPARARVARWPFALYAILWVSLAVATYFLLQGPQADIPAFRQEAYPYLLLGGLVLMLLGPLLSVLLWFVAWRKAKPEDRGGLFTRSMIRGAAITFLGVAAWYAALNLVDVIRLGWI